MEMWSPNPWTAWNSWVTRLNFDRETRETAEEQAEGSSEELVKIAGLCFKKFASCHT